jgi:hypothetical protein
MAEAAAGASPPKKKEAEAGEEAEKPKASAYARVIKSGAPPRRVHTAAVAGVAALRSNGPLEG